MFTDWDHMSSNENASRNGGFRAAKFCLFAIFSAATVGCVERAKGPLATPIVESVQEALTAVDGLLPSDEAPRSSTNPVAKRPALQPASLGGKYSVESGRHAQSGRQKGGCRVDRYSVVPGGARTDVEPCNAHHLPRSSGDNAGCHADGNNHRP